MGIHGGYFCILSILSTYIGDKWWIFDTRSSAVQISLGKSSEFKDCQHARVVEDLENGELPVWKSFLS